MKEITSPSNALIRQVEQLQRKSKARKEAGLFIVEGQREIMLCDRGDYTIETLLVCGSILFDNRPFNQHDVYRKLQIKQEPEIVSIPKEIYSKLAYRDGTEGCIAFAKAKKHKLTDLNIEDTCLLLVAEGTEKPGNIGALLRTADAAGIDAVVLVDPVSDVYNPNVIRSSIGCTFTVPIVVTTAIDFVSFLKVNKIDLFAATLQTSKNYDSVSYLGKTAIAVGTEATGLSQTLRDAAIHNIIIPMSGTIDSMNVSVSAAILLFEAKRQRKILSNLKQ